MKKSKLLYLLLALIMFSCATQQENEKIDINLETGPSNPKKITVFKLTRDNQSNKKVFNVFNETSSSVGIVDQASGITTTIGVNQLYTTNHGIGAYEENIYSEFSLSLELSSQQYVIKDYNGFDFNVSGYTFAIHPVKYDPVVVQTYSASGLNGSGNYEYTWFYSKVLNGTESDHIILSDPSTTNSPTVDLTFNYYAGVEYKIVLELQIKDTSTGKITLQRKVITVYPDGNSGGP